MSDRGGGRTHLVGGGARYPPNRWILWLLFCKPSFQSERHYPMTRQRLNNDQVQGLNWLKIFFSKIPVIVFPWDLLPREIDQWPRKFWLDSWFSPKKWWWSCIPVAMFTSRLFFFGRFVICCLGFDMKLQLMCFTCGVWYILSISIFSKILLS